MDAGQVERLFLRNGEQPTPSHLARLEALTAQNTQLRSASVRRRILPWGTHTHFSGQGGRGTAPVFAPDVTITGSTALVRWSGPRALIGGVAPKIKDREIFADDPATGLRPALEVTEKDFNELGECSVFFRVEVDEDFRAKTVEPIASPKLPLPSPHNGYCLALFLRMRGGAMDYDEDTDRQLFTAQGFFAATRRPNGVFESLFWART